MLVAILFEVLVVTGFLIGVGGRVLLRRAAAWWGSRSPAISVLGTGVATLFALNRGDSFLLDLSKARKADPSIAREAMLRNVVAELALGANLPAPEVYVIDAGGRERVRRRAATRPTRRSRSPAGCWSCSTARSSRASSHTSSRTSRTSTRATA